MSRTARWFVPVLAFGLLLGLAGEQTRAQEDKNAVGTVSGTVKGQDGEAAEGINVRVVPPSNGNKGGDPALAPAEGEKKKKRGPKPVAQTKTDADGKFTLENVPVGSYLLMAGGGPKGRAQQAVEVKEGETVTVELQLAPGPKRKQ